MIRTRLTRALTVALTLACLAGGADASVHRSWDDRDDWHFHREAWDGFGHHDIWGGPGWRDTEFRWSFDGAPFWEGRDGWRFGNDDAWARLARFLCQSIFGDIADCGGETALVDVAPSQPDPQPAPVPLPAGLPLLGAALAALALVRQRRG